MIRIRDTLGSDPISFHIVETGHDYDEVIAFVQRHKALGIDTEATGINPYKPGWQLRTMQIGNSKRSYVIPNQHAFLMLIVMKQPIKWIGHNGPHDMRCIDVGLGQDTGVTCAGETFIVAHLFDSRKVDEGGVAHGLKEQAIAHVSRDAGKWETALKKEFKQIRISVPGEVYKSGKRKGEQKTRAAHISEGWGLIDPMHPAYLAYAAADPILTYRLWRHYQPVLRQFHKQYKFDWRVQQAADKLYRRAMRIDTNYTTRLSAAFDSRAQKFRLQAKEEFACANVNSGQQVASVLMQLGAQLTSRTPTGLYKTDDKILRGLLSEGNEAVNEFIHCVLGAKQLLKRRENYTEAFLREMDDVGRVHPSINILGARTGRMSVSNPALQQLPTKDREEDE